MEFHSRGYDRGLRVAQLLRSDLVDILRLKFRDRRIDTTYLCVEEMRLNRDLTRADVFVSCLEVSTPEQKQLLIDVLNHAKGFLRSQLARRNNIRTTPELFFHFDDTREQSRHVDALIESAIQREDNGT